MCELGRCIYNVVDCTVCGFSDAAAPVDLEEVDQLIKGLVDPEPQRCSDDEFKELMELLEQELMGKDDEEYVEW